MTRKQRNKVWRDLRDRESIMTGGENIGGWVEDIRPLGPGKLFHLIYNKSELVVCRQDPIGWEVPTWVKTTRVKTYNITVYPKSHIHYEYLDTHYYGDFTEDIV